MFKKKNTFSPNGDNKSQTVVTESVEESTDGVVRTTTTRTIVSSSGGHNDDMESAFKDFHMNPSKMTGSYVTKRTTYTSSGQEITDEVDETFSSEKPKQKDNKNSKSLSEKLGLKSKPKESNEVHASNTKPPNCMKTGQFEEDSLKSHNSYRVKHGVPKLKLSKQLCSYAKEWADHLAATDSFQHRTQRTYGENIFMKWSSDPTHLVTGEEAVDSWYSEIKDHVFGKEPTSLKSGHFTQVIWKESTELGVSWARSKSGKVLVVANYNPAGNFVGKFTENVPPPKK